MIVVERNRTIEPAHCIFHILHKRRRLSNNYQEKETLAQRPRATSCIDKSVGVRLSLRAQHVVLRNLSDSSVGPSAGRLAYERTHQLQIVYLIQSSFKLCNTPRYITYIQNATILPPVSIATGMILHFASSPRMIHSDGPHPCTDIRYSIPTFRF